MTDPSDSLTARFFELSDAPLAVLDREGCFLRTNAAWRAGGFRAAAPLGTPFVDLLVPEDAERIGTFLAQLSGSARFDAKLTAASTGTHIRLMRFFATHDDQSGAVQLVCIDGVAMEAEVERERVLLKTFSQVIDSAPVVLWSTDAAGVLSIHEGKGLELVGMESGAMVGRNVFDQFEAFPVILDAVRRGFAGQTARWLDSFPGDEYFDSWLFPMKGKDDAVLGVVGLAIHATERVRKERELNEQLELVQRQSATIRSLATPIIQVWDGVICLPVIGTVDSQRIADMMQNLMESIVRERARYAIVDLTGVELVDTSTAEHLVHLFQAAKILGVEGILCGIRPAVAQTIVALGVDLSSIRTMASLRNALTWCIETEANTKVRSVRT